MIKIVETDMEIGNCFAVIQQLRPHLIQETFIVYVKTLLAEGYQLAYKKENDRVVCVAGFRISHNLFAGKNLYVDDLATLENERSKGYGEEMINWLRAFAIEQECIVFHLDSGVQRHRAHKFYLNQGMDIVSYHFLQKLR